MVVGMVGVLLTLAGCAAGAGDAAFRRNPSAVRPSAGPARRWEARRIEAGRPEDGPELTEDSPIEDYFEYALLSNEDLRAAQLRWEAAAERPLQARTLPDPRISFQADTSFESREIALMQTFPWYGTRALRGSAEERAALAEYARYQARQWEVLRDVRNAYAEYYYLERTIEITDENLELMEHFQEVVRTRFEAGAVPHADLVRIEVETEKLRDRLEELRQRRRPRRAALNQVLGRPHDAPLPRPAGPPRIELPLEEAELFELALEHSPQLLARRHEIDRAGDMKALAGKAYYPDITVGVMRMEEGMGGMGPDINAAMVSLNIPLWRGSYDAGVREARARLRAGRRSLADAEYMVQVQLENALFRHRDARRRSELFETYLLPRAEESLAVSETAYRAGQVDVIELLDAQRELLNLELELERAHIEWFTSIGDIERLLGGSVRETAEPAELGPETPTQREN